MEFIVLFSFDIQSMALVGVFLGKHDLLLIGAVVENNGVVFGKVERCHNIILGAID